MKEVFENSDMAHSVFHKVNLLKAEFDDVNLGEATFRNVNLGKATIRNANLGDLQIEDANIRGLTVFGFRIDELIEAELDRRDPERVRLRMADRYDLDCVRGVLNRLDDLRARFIAALRAADPALLQARPQPGEWSPVEILRHLVFAEDLYTNRWLLRNDEPWCRLGQRPAFLDGQPGYEEVGSQPSGDLETILAAWAGIHARLKDFVAELSPEDLRRETHDVDFGQGTVAGILQGLAQHDLVHIRQVEAVLNIVC
jgi:hypothetical protein